MKTVFCIQFTEYERGWGNRPDSWTLHQDEQSARLFAANYNVTHNNKGSVPAVYCLPGKPYPVQLSEEDYERIFKMTALYYGKGNSGPAANTLVVL